MKRFATGGIGALALTLFLGAGAARAQLIEKKPADKEPTTDTEFVIHGLACEVGAVKFAEQGVKNAKSDEVRKFAEKMLADHTRAREAMLGRARDLKIGVVEGLDKEKKERIERLAKLEGAAFDREFMKQTIEHHVKAVQQYERCARIAKDEKLQEHAKKAAATFKEHLEMARQISERIKDKD